MGGSAGAFGTAGNCDFLAERYKYINGINWRHVGLKMAETDCHYHLEIGKSILIISAKNELKKSIWLRNYCNEMI